MALFVQKFGGTSVANAEKIRAAAQRAIAARRQGHDVVMVVSARGKKTDELVSLAAEMTDRPPAREMDMLLSTGEQESVALMAMAIEAMGEHAISLTGGQIGVLTDSSFTRSRIKHIATERIRRHLGEGKIVIACGFQGVDADLNITTLGRGGSDTTAAALAAVMDADECEIYTDVDGVFTTDPRLVPEAQLIPRISYDEMLELASLGAGVMHSRSIEFAKKFRVPLRVRPSDSDGEGTLIERIRSDYAPPVTGLALVERECRVSLTGIPDEPGVMQRIFASMAARVIPIDMVVQNVGQAGHAEVSFTLPEADLALAITAAEEAVAEIGDGEVRQGTNVAKVSAVGAGMRSHSGVAARMFRALASAEINIQMITTSEIKVSVLVSRDRCRDALRAIHDEFQLHDPQQRERVITGDEPIAPEAGHLTEAAEDRQQAVIQRLTNMEDIVVSEVQLDASQARVTLHDVHDEPGIAAALFEAVASADILVDMIVQNIGQHNKSHISMTVPQRRLEDCVEQLKQVTKGFEGISISTEAKIAKLSVLGIGLRSHTGVGKQMFTALAEAGINVQMINTSEVVMSAVVAESDGKRGLEALRRTFAIGEEKSHQSA